MASRKVTVTQVDPMSAFKISICMALVGFAAWLIAVTILYIAVDAVGVGDSLNSQICVLYTYDAADDRVLV